MNISYGQRRQFDEKGNPAHLADYHMPVESGVEILLKPQTSEDHNTLDVLSKYKNIDITKQNITPEISGIVSQILGHCGYDLGHACVRIGPGSQLPIPEQYALFQEKSTKDTAKSKGGLYDLIAGFRNAFGMQSSKSVADVEKAMDVGVYNEMTHVPLLPIPREFLWMQYHVAVKERE